MIYLYYIPKRNIRQAKRKLKGRPMDGLFLSGDGGIQFEFSFPLGMKIKERLGPALAGSIQPRRISFGSNPSTTKQGKTTRGGGLSAWRRWRDLNPRTPCGA